MWAPVGGVTARTIAVFIGALVVAAFALLWVANSGAHAAHGAPGWAAPVLFLAGLAGALVKAAKAFGHLRTNVAQVYAEERNPEPAILSCSRCGSVLPSRYYFATMGDERLCRSCSPPSSLS